MPNLICRKCGITASVDTSSYHTLRALMNLDKWECMFCDPQGLVYQKTMPTQLPLPLPKGFSVPGPKTLKPDVDETLGLAHLVTEARTYLNGQTQYTRIEFKFERNWIVVAKLKE